MVGGHTDGRREGWKDVNTKERNDGLTDIKQKDGRADGRAEGRTDGSSDRRADDPTVRRTDKRPGVPTEGSKCELDDGRFMHHYLQ